MFTVKTRIFGTWKVFAFGSAQRAINFADKVQALGQYASLGVVKQITIGGR